MINEGESKPSPASIIPIPVIPNGTPSGLEYLLPTTQVIIMEQREWGAMDHHNTVLGKQFHIVDSNGKRIYFAIIIIAPCHFGTWTIIFHDMTGREVMSATHFMRGGCCCCCHCCTLDDGFDAKAMITDTPLGGMVKISGRGCEHNTWNILDGDGTPVLVLNAPHHCCRCCVLRTFPFSTMDGQQCGQITSYNLGGVAHRSNFGVEFPADLAVQTKAVLIFAMIVLDRDYVSRPESERRRHSHAGSI